MSPVAAWWRWALVIACFVVWADMVRAQPASASTSEAAPDSIDAPALYQQHCAACHGAQRLGAMGPALLPESLQRLRPAEALAVIRQGRKATQMTGFDGALGISQTAALAEYIYTPVTLTPTWDEAAIRASRSALKL